MEISIIQYLIVCPLVFLAGFVDAVAGGGGLISLPAYLIAGFPVHFAIGTNKVSSAMGTTLTTVRYTKSGFIPWKQAIFCVLFALAGSACGANLALLIDDGVFKIIMLVILPLTALYVMKGKALSGKREPYSKLKTMLLSCVIAFVLSPCFTLMDLTSPLSLSAGGVYPAGSQPSGGFRRSSSDTSNMTAKNAAPVYIIVLFTPISVSK